MTLKTWLAGMLGAATLGLVATSAQAAPAGGMADLKGTAALSDVQLAHGYGYYDYPRYRHRHRYYRYNYYYGPRYHHRHWRHYRRW
jgi:hypothetical protein